MRILYIEPFDAGSHAAFTRALTAHVDAQWTVSTLPGRHWKWRMRGAGLYLAERDAARLNAAHDLLLASSFTPLADLIALVPALAAVPKVLYFHENQWTYPVRDERERDHHYGFSQLVSAAVADLCLFNSQHNRDGFLRACGRFVGRMPDARPESTLAALGARCEVMPLPIEFGPVADPSRSDVPPGPARGDGPLLLWNHRWEHDKAPEVFFAVLDRVAAAGVPFRLAVCGQRFRSEPDAFARGRATLASRIVQFGHVDAPAAYRGWLERAQLAVSTARHEFFGVAMLEATHAGAHPLVPDALAYPELFPARFRYRDADDLEARLVDLCGRWTAGAIDLRAPRAGITDPVAAARVARALSARLRGVQRRR